MAAPNENLVQIKDKYNNAAANKSTEAVRDKPLELKCKLASSMLTSCVIICISQGTDKQSRIDIVPELTAVAIAIYPKP